MGSQPPSYDVARDGRFLMLKPIGGDTAVAPSRVRLTIWNQLVGSLTFVSWNRYAEWLWQLKGLQAQTPIMPAASSSSGQ